MKILVTGAAGFIGFHTAKQLLDRGDTVVGLDNFNDYYDVRLKESRAAVLDAYDNFSMHRIDLANRDAMESLFKNEIQEFRRRGLRVAEVTSLAHGLPDKRPSWKIAVRLMSFMVQFSVARRIDRLLIAVNPQHVAFYRRTVLISTRDIATENLLQFFKWRIGDHVDIVKFFAA